MKLRKNFYIPNKLYIPKKSTTLYGSTVVMEDALLSSKVIISVRNFDVF